MKKLKILVIFLFLLVPTLVFASDFRNSSWGDSKLKVRAQEKAEFIGENKLEIHYKSELADIDIGILYSFYKGKLYEGFYINKERYSYSNHYITDYKKIKKLLIKKYGKPDEDKIIWLDDLFKNKPKDWGTAIGAGHLIYRTIWYTKTTRIIHVLGGDNFKINHGIIYTNKKLIKKKKTDKEQEAVDNL